MFEKGYPGLYSAASYLREKVLAFSEEHLLKESSGWGPRNFKSAGKESISLSAISISLTLVKKMTKLSASFVQLLFEVLYTLNILIIST